MVSTPTPSSSGFRRADLFSPSGVDEQITAALTGREAVYRLGFASMQVTGMPARLNIGRVSVEHVIGPVESQQTTIVQEPGFQPTFVKWMEHPLVGAGQPLTIYSMKVVLPADINGALGMWRSEALAVAGFLAMMLDERMAQEQMLEDLSVLAPINGVNVRIDVQRQVRTFEPTHPWFDAFEVDLGRFAAPDVSPRLHAACRWYHRAVTAGPTAEGFVLLWVVMECVLPAPAGGQSRNEVREIEAALQRADPTLDPSAMNPSLGRLSGLRAKIVHQGLEVDPMIADGYYTLEAVTRLLLRHEFAVTQGWPYFPATPMLAEPLLSMNRPPETQWREPPGATS